VKSYFSFIVFVSLVIALVFAINYSNSQQKQIDTQVVILQGNGKIFHKYFNDETDIILSAAKRNNCNTKQDLCILFAIRKAEAGKKGFEFGIKNPKADNLDKQAGWAAATIVKNRERWNKTNKLKPFIEFLGDRYCPVTGDLSNKERELNKHWVSNVRYWSENMSNKY